MHIAFLVPGPIAAISGGYGYDRRIIAELRKILDTVDYYNLDDLPQLKNQNTTTEYMAHHIWTLLATALKAGTLGDGGQAVTALKVLLREAPTAWAAYEAPIY